MRLIAIDPGASGGIAWTTTEGEVKCMPMPDGEAEIVEALADVVYHRGHSFTWVEDVGFHVAGNNASASCKFAMSVGVIRGALLALQAPYDLVKPTRWMRGIGAPTGDKADRKRAIRDMMARRYPACKVTLKTADALGILTWAMERVTP